MSSSSRWHDVPKANSYEVIPFVYLQPHGFLPDVAVDLAHLPALEEGAEGLCGEEGVPGPWVIGFAYGEHWGDFTVDFGVLYVRKMLIIICSCVIMFYMEKQREAPMAILRVEGGKYIYDFGNALPYGGPTLALVNQITDKYTINSPWRNGMGFAVKYAVRPDGSKHGFMDLQVPSGVPRELVQSIFNDLNASGLVQVALTTEMYPSTAHRRSS